MILRIFLILLALLLTAGVFGCLLLTIDIVDGRRLDMAMSPYFGIKANVWALSGVILIQALLLCLILSIIQMYYISKNKTS